MKLEKSVREFIANSIEEYLLIREQCIISDITDEENQKNTKKVRKLIKKIRSGDMSVFNEDELERELPHIMKMMESRQL